MKKRMKLYITIIGIVCGALSYWFNPYNEMYLGKINIYYLMLSLAFFANIILGFVYKKQFLKVPIYFCIGFIISVLGRIFFDISKDPSTHNLFPFEIIFVMIIIVPTSIIGSYLIHLINKKRGN